MYLRYEKKLIKITEEQAQAIAGLIDNKQPVQLGFERLNPWKCEIISALPYNWSDYQIIDDSDTLKLDRPEFSAPLVKRKPEEQKKVTEALNKTKEFLSKNLNWKK